MFYRARQVIINFYRDYSLLASKTKDVAKPVEGLKILAPKQMLQRLIITLAKVKLENTSVYETRSDKLFTFCIDQKKLLRRYININNITKSMQILNRYNIYEPRK